MKRETRRQDMSLSGFRNILLSHHFTMTFLPLWMYMPCVGLLILEA